MFDAFAGWARLSASGYSLAETGMRALETLDAARQVVAKRSAVIGTVFRSPSNVDHAELDRMVPEKMEAFLEAGSVTVAAWWSMHSAWLNQIQHLGVMASRGKTPTIMEIVDLNSRTATLTLETIEAGARLGSESLAPVHRKAMANARRLCRMGE